MSFAPDISANDHQQSGLSPCLLSCLAELSLACMLYTTQTDDTVEFNLDVKNCLFNDVMQLFMAQTSILEKLLDDLLSKVPGRASNSLSRKYEELSQLIFYSISSEVDHL